MLMKLVVGAVAAGALSIPLAGVAWADQPAEPGINGAGPNGVGAPGAGIQANNNVGVRDVAQLEGSVPDAIATVQPGPGIRIAPGQLIKTFVPGHTK